MAPAAWVALGAVIRALYWWAAYNARSCNLRLIMIGAGCQNVTYWRNVFWDQLRLLISLHFPRPSPDTFWCHTPRDAGCASASICSFSLRAFLSLTCTADGCVPLFVRSFFTLAHQDVAWEPSLLPYSFDAAQDRDCWIFDIPPLPSSPMYETSHRNAWP